MTLQASDWPRIIADPSIAEVYNTETGEAMQLEWVRKQGCWYHIAPFFEAAWMFDEDGSHRCYPYAIRLRTPEPAAPPRVSHLTQATITLPQVDVVSVNKAINEAAGLTKPEPVAPAEIPHWAKVMACELANAEELEQYSAKNIASCGAATALARLIAKHEKEPEPVDPLVEALETLKDGRAGPTTESYAACLRAELAKRGLEVGRVK